LSELPCPAKQPKRISHFLNKDFPIYLKIIFYLPLSDSPTPRTSAFAQTLSELLFPARQPKRISHFLNKDFPFFLKIIFYFTPVGLTHSSNVGLCTNFVGAAVPC